MKTQKQILAIAVLLAAGIAAYMGWAAWRAHTNLVTLDVRNMDVREVVRKLEHQTWENIQVDKNVRGKVTLRVRGVPLDEVLRLVGDQTGSRSLVLFPLYSSGSSLKKLEATVRGEMNPGNSGWTNLPPAFGPGMRGPMGGVVMVTLGGPGGPFGAMPDSPNQRVSLDIRAKELSFAVLAFSRFAQARVVPEDGAGGIVSLSVRKAPVAKAVGLLAQKAKRKWTKIYVLRGFGGPGGPGMRGPGGPQMVMRAGPGGDMMMGRGPGGPPPPSEQQRDEMRQQREVLEQELRAVLPADERQKLEQEQAQRQQQMQELASLTPEQRRDRMGQMGMGGPGGGGFDKMNRQRVLGSTPEQRAENTRREKDMRQRMAQQPSR